MTSIYLNLNTVMLGFMRGDDAVGFYTAGNKLSHVVLSVVASLGVVLLPRCSNLIETGQMEAFSKSDEQILPFGCKFVTALYCRAYCVGDTCNMYLLRGRILGGSPRTLLDSPYYLVYRFEQRDRLADPVSVG